MSDKSAETKSGGIGFLGLLTILFIGLKLTNYIDWSWWGVLAPMWLPVAVVLGFFLGMFAIAGLIALVAIALDR